MGIRNTQVKRTIILAQATVKVTITMPSVSVISCVRTHGNKAILIQHSETFYLMSPSYLQAAQANLARSYYFFESLCERSARET